MKLLLDEVNRDYLIKSLGLIEGAKELLDKADKYTAIFPPFSEVDEELRTIRMSLINLIIKLNRKIGI